MQDSTRFEESESGNRLVMPLSGAVGFGASFAFFGAIWGALFSQIASIGFFPRHMLISVLYACATGFGAITFAIGRKTKPVHLFGAGAIGCGLGYLLSVAARNTLLNLVNSLARQFIPIPFEMTMEITLILQFILMGAVTGIFLGFLYKPSEMILTLALAGACGFGVGQWLGPSPKTLTRLILSFPVRTDEVLLYAMMQAVYNAIIGVLSGILFGWITRPATVEPRFPRNNETDLFD